VIGVAPTGLHLHSTASFQSSPEGDSLIILSLPAVKTAGYYQTSRRRGLEYRSLFHLRNLETTMRKYRSG
jgi:hypothetical protein